MPDAAPAPDRDECPAELFRRLFPRLRRALLRYKISEADSEDLLQEIFLVFFLRRDSIESPEAWLFGTLRKRCLIHWRQHRAREAHLQSLAPLELLPHSFEDPLVDRLLLTEALGRLSSRDRQILIHRVVLQYSSTEIDRALGTSPGTARKLVQRALERLRRALDQPGYEPQNTRQRHPHEARMSLR